MKQDPLSNPLYWINVLNPNPLFGGKFIVQRMKIPSWLQTVKTILFAIFFDSPKTQILGRVRSHFSRTKIRKKSKVFYLKKISRQSRQGIYPSLPRHNQRFYHPFSEGIFRQCFRIQKPSPLDRFRKIRKSIDSQILATFRDKIIQWVQSIQIGGTYW